MKSEKYENFKVGEIKGRYYYGEKGTFVLIHGLASSSGEFFDYPEKINAEGYSVIIFDLSGHGESGGISGYESVDKNIEDIELVLNYFKDKIKSPLVLLGHSLGASTVIYALERGIGDMCVAIAPPATIKGELNVGERLLLPAIYHLGRIYEKLTNRLFYIKYRTVYESIFVHDETVKIARELGFLNNKIWIGSYKPLMSVNTVEAAKNVNKPCLVIIPSKDNLVNPKHQREVYRALGKWGELYIAEGYNHSVMGEDRGDILNRIMSFVSSHAKA